MKYGDAAAVLSATTTVTRTTATVHSELIKLEQRKRKANAEKIK